MIQRIVSGGQTGVDRAALDAALDADFPCGGWCPLGRLAEDGPLDARYPLTEAETDEYAERTELNVFDSDGTLILTRGQPTGGTAFTIACAEAHGRPYLHLDLDVLAEASTAFDWANTYEIAVLNVAGPRERNAPGIYDAALVFMRELIGLVQADDG